MPRLVVYLITVTTKTSFHALRCRQQMEGAGHGAQRHLALYVTQFPTVSKSVEVKCQMTD